MRDAEREKAKRGGLGGFPAEPKAQSVARRDSAQSAVQPSLQEALRGFPPLSFHTQEVSPFRESGIPKGTLRYCLSVNCLIYCLFRLELSY